MNIIIAGNGPAAISAVEAIREIDRSSSITLLSREKERAYSPCYLYHYISEDISRDKLYIKEDDFYEKNNVNILFGISLEKVIPDKRSVRLSNGKTLTYDRLLLATGAEAVLPGIPGIQGEGVFFFKSLQDAERIISIIPKIKKAAVIGGGFIGLEIAEALRKKGISVTVIEKEDRLLPRMLDKEMAGIVSSHLLKNGIDIITGKVIKEIERRDGHLCGLTTRDGITVPTDIVIVSAGVRPNIKPAEDTGIRTARGIIVNEKMETSIPDIYAAGDVAEIEIKGIRKLNPIWLNATVSGSIAGSNMIRISKKLDAHIPDMNMINLFGLYIFSAGSPEGTGSVKREDSAGIKKFIFDEDNRLKGIQIIGNEALKGGLYLNLLGRVLKESQELIGEFNYGLFLEPSMKWL